MSTQELSKIIDINLQQIDKKFDDAIFAKAKAMRKDMAQKIIANLEPNELQSIDVKKTMLRTVLERTPFENTEKILQFNILITDILCDAVLNMDNISSIEKVGLYSNIIELGAREFISLDNVNKVFLHLGTAKDLGFFFTPPSLAIRMVALSIKYNSTASSVLDPACGSGVFLAYNILLNKNITEISGIEIDERTADFAKKLLIKLCEAENRPIKVDIICANFFEFFENNINGTKYDSIIMNPPYGNLKFLASDLTDSSTRANMPSEKQEKLSERLRIETLNHAARLRQQFAPYGMGKGTLEYSKLFMAATHEMLTDIGFTVAITPSSWLGDETSTSFRNTIVSNGYIHELWMIPEVAKIFKGVNQPTTVSVLGKTPSHEITVCNPVLKITEVETMKSKLDLASVLAVSGEKTKLPQCNQETLKLLVKFQNFKKIGAISEIVNARGELDLTTYKSFVSKTNTGHRLIRGDHIEKWILKDASESEKPGYVLFDDFMKCINSSSKAAYVSQSRIAIPQCSYLKKKKRIEAAIVPANSVISNSCNFLAITCENRAEKEFYYWMVINSSVLEWQFRIFNYNNHVANKEISELTCIEYSSLSEQARSEINQMFRELIEYNYCRYDAFVASLFELSISEYQIILQELSMEGIENYLEEYKTCLENVR